MIKFATPTNLALLSGLALAALAGFLVIPAGAALPVHWNLSGEIDGWMPRELALLMPPAIVALVWGIFLGIGRFARAPDVAAGAYITRVTVTALTGLLLAVEIVIILIGMGVAVNMVQIIALGIGLLLIVLGNAMPKSQPNSFAGLRIPSTLRDPANWQATHRLTGWLCILGGAVLVAAAILVPIGQLFWWPIAAIAIPIATGTLYSIWMGRRPS
jgi:uncharacterized membrane protein